MAIHSSILARKIPRTRSLVGYLLSPWGHKELDTTDHAHTQMVFGKRKIKVHVIPILNFQNVPESIFKSVKIYADILKCQ